MRGAPSGERGAGGDVCRIHTRLWPSAETCLPRHETKLPKAGARATRTHALLRTHRCVATACVPTGGGGGSRDTWGITSQGPLKRVGPLSLRPHCQSTRGTLRTLRGLRAAFSVPAQSRTLIRGIKNKIQHPASGNVWHPFRRYQARAPGWLSRSGVRLGLGSRSQSLSSSLASGELHLSLSLSV